MPPQAPSSPHPPRRRLDLSEPGIRASAVGLAANVLLAAAKLVVGAWAGSQALVADGFNSAGDVLGSLVAAAGYALAWRPPDDEHPYGHGNADAIAGLVVAAILLATGLYIGTSGLIGLARGQGEVPGVAAAWVAGATVVVKEGLYHYTRAVARRVRSTALLASASDHRADVVSALAVLLGILGSRWGWTWLDAATAVGVGGLIVLLAWEPLRENLAILMGAADPALTESVFLVARRDPDVREVGGLRVRRLGPYAAADLDIYVPGDTSLFEAHTVAHRVEDAILDQVPVVRDVRVHVNPTGMPPRTRRARMGRTGVREKP